MAYEMGGPLFFGKKRKARKASKDAEMRKKGIEDAKTDDSFKKEIEKRSGKSFDQLQKENQ